MLNCWQVMECGREPGGQNAVEEGVCPIAADLSLEGLNDGTKGGRICWAVVGTFCSGKVQGTFADKLDTCTTCEFFKLVRQEQGEDFMDIPVRCTEGAGTTD